MTISERGRHVAIGSAFWLLSSAAAAVGHPCVPFTDTPEGTPGDVVIQEFPPEGPIQTAWKVRFAHAKAKGLFVTGAWFKAAPDEEWLPVLTQAGVADIFVPYHSGTPRYLDMTQFSFSLVSATEEDAGHCGRVVDGRVIQEVRSRGLLWKKDGRVRHGHELVLWGTFGAAYYNYVMSYAFGDDGTISLRVGATGSNRPQTPYEAHMHSTLWRIDVGLDDENRNSAYEAFHEETTDGISAKDRMRPFNGGIEGALEWEARRFTELRVTSERTNKWDHVVSYDFRPVVYGTARHQESFTHGDFWVTRYRNGEDYYSELEGYANGESVTEEDIVVWHMSSTHHEPRDEDGHIEGGVWTGAAVVMWNGIDLRPRNLFNTTPFFP